MHCIWKAFITKQKFLIVDIIILPSEKKEYSIPQWQIDKVRERTEKYLKNPENVTNIDDFLKEIENEL